MIKKPNSNVARLRRHQRVRKNISGTAEKPRLNVFRSLNHIYAQIIDDTKGTTLVSASSLDKAFEGLKKKMEESDFFRALQQNAEKEIAQVQEQTVPIAPVEPVQTAPVQTM